VASNLIQVGLKVSLECIGRGRITTIEGPQGCGKTRAAAQLVAGLVHKYSEVFYASKNGDFARELDAIKCATEYTWLRRAYIGQTNADNFEDFLTDGSSPDIFVIDSLEDCVRAEHREKAMEMIRQRVDRDDGSHTHIIVVRRG
jgi:RecA/RadA recombinase